MPVERAPGGTSLIDVLDRILDKGIIIDAWVRISLVGIDLVTVEARVVVASIDTYLRYADALGLMSAQRTGSLGAGGEPEAIARQPVLPLALSDDPIVAALRGGLAERIRDATTDERISPAIRETLAKAKLGPIVAAPLRSTTERRTIGQDGKRSAAAG